jgi:hypothetical protein
MRPVADGLGSLERQAHASQACASALKPGPGSLRPGETAALVRSAHCSGAARQSLPWPGTETKLRQISTSRQSWRRPSWVVLAGQQWRRMRDSNSRGVAPNTLSNHADQRSPASAPPVTWTDCDGWVSADADESRRMRPQLRPARTPGRCRQRGPHLAACISPVLFLIGGPRGPTVPDGAEPAVAIAG